MANIHSNDSLIPTHNGDFARKTLYSGNGGTQTFQGFLSLPI